MATARIISFSGGGFRGLMFFPLLLAIAEKTGKDFHEMFNMFAGVSTGTFPAFGLADGGINNPPKSPSFIRDVYKKSGDIIFPQNTRKRHTALNLIKDFNNPKFTNTGLIKIVSKHYGKALLSNYTKNDVMTYSIQEQQGMPIELRHYNSWDQNQDSVFNAIMGSTAATTVLPEFVNGNLILSDGGMHEKNPSRITYDIARDRYTKADDILVVSFGTGIKNDPQNMSKLRNRGLSFGGKYMYELLSNTAYAEVSKEMQRRIGENYIHFDTILPDAVKGGPSYKMEDTSAANLRACEELGEIMLKDPKNQYMLAKLLERLQEKTSTIAELTAPKEEKPSISLLRKSHGPFKYDPVSDETRAAAIAKQEEKPNNSGISHLQMH